MKKNTLKIALFISLLIINFNIVMAQIYVDFGAQPAQGCAPLTVQFFSLTTNSNLTYHWDFGNGNFSNLMHPQAIFFNPGKYTIKLTVSDGVNNSTKTKINYIFAFHRPVANFSITSDTIGCTPYHVNFNDNTMLGDTFIAQWSWVFGNGMTSNLQNPQTTFTNAGEYTVGLKVTDRNGCMNQTTIADFITVKAIPIVNFTTLNGNGCDSTEIVRFTDQSVGQSLLYYWSFGDGAHSSARNPNHNYIGFGHYDVSLKTTDIFSCSATLLKPNNVNFVDIKAQFVLPKDTICIGESITIQNLSTLGINYKWDFGNGTNATVYHPQLNYNISGSYEIKLITSFENYCSDTIEKTIVVENVSANFTQSKSVVCRLPDSIQLVNLSTNAFSWDWQFSNGQTSQLKNPIFNLPSNQELNDSSETFFTTEINVTSSHGCKSKLIKINNINVAIPSAKFIADENLFGCAPLQIQLRDHSTYFSTHDSIINYSWDFGDGSFSNLKEPNHIWITPGDYITKLSISTKHGCVYDVLNTVYVGSKQFANFEYHGLDTICGSQPISLLSAGIDSTLINGWLYNFSDNSISNMKNPTFMAQDTGWIDGTMFSIYNGCYSDSYTLNNFVYVKGPINSISPMVSCSYPLNWLFLGKVIDGNHFYWDFGDSSAIDTTTLYPTHTFAQKGDYNVSLYSLNTQNNCAYQITSIVPVRILKASFSTDNDHGCSGMTVAFNSGTCEDEVEFAHDSYYKKYLWNFGDSTAESFTNDSIVTHTYVNPGIYEATITVADINQCFRTFSKQIRVYKPLVEFISDVNRGCVPLEVHYGSIIYSDTTFSLNWNFGDGNSSNLGSPIHTYNNSGYYNVSIVVTDVLGCTSTTTIPSYIHATKPVSNFLIIDSTLCLGDSLYVTNNSIGEQLSFSWNFGDGNQSLTQQPTHQYSDSGVYPISLQVTDVNGCLSFANANSFVQALPIADFDVNQRKFSCFPSVACFTDLTTSFDTLKFEWNFGDNTGFSNLENPYHVFTKPGEYDIELIATTNFGCKDSILKPELMEILGPFARVVVPDSACINTEINLTMVDTLNVFSYLWDLGDGNITGQNLVNHIYTQSGNIFPLLYLTTDTIHTCDKVFQDTIYISDISTRFTLPSFGLCQNAPIYVESFSNEIGNYQWFLNNDSISENANISFSIPDAGINELKLLMQNHLGCKDSMIKTLIINPLPITSITNDTSICNYESIELKATGGNEYYWTPEEYLMGNQTNIMVAEPLTNTLFNVKVMDLNGCVNYDSVQVNLSPLPELQMPSDTTILVGEKILLQPIIPINCTIQWDPSKWLSCYDCVNPEIKPFETCEFTAVIKDDAGCSNFGTTTVYINDECLANLPDYFTPNGDDENEIIFIKGRGIQELILFQVFDSWGNEIYKSSDINLGWDGRYNGNLVSIGTYAYIFHVRFYNQSEITKSGTFSLLK